MPHLDQHLLKALRRLPPLQQHPPYLRLQRCILRSDSLPADVRDRQPLPDVLQAPPSQQRVADLIRAMALPPD